MPAARLDAIELAREPDDIVSGHGVEVAETVAELTGIGCDTVQTE